MTTLILEHASLVYSFSSRPTLNDVLDEAYGKYLASGIHDELIRLSPTLQEPSKSTTFILENRLQV